MGKLILTDLDGTLIDKNTEKEFMIYFLKDKNFRFRKFINFCYWLISKLQSRFLSRDINCKYFYYKIDSEYLDHLVKKWLKSIDFSKFRINEEIINNKEDNDLIFILTNSPSFLSLPFCQKFLPCKINGIFSTELHSINTLYHFKIKRKMVSNYKRTIAKKLINHYNYVSFGYGDSPSDAPFVSICDKQFLGNFFN